MEITGITNKRKKPDILSSDSEDESLSCKPVLKEARKFTDEELLQHFRRNPVLKKEKRFCIFSLCNKQASFGPKGGARYRCKTHKLSTDVNNRIKKCVIDGCEISASFGPVDGPKVFRCRKHRLQSDINKTNAICSHPKCKKTASFGPTDGVDAGKKITCEDHKLPSYINNKKNTKNTE